MADLLKRGRQTVNRPDLDYVREDLAFFLTQTEPLMVKQRAQAKLVFPCWERGTAATASSSWFREDLVGEPALRGP